ncbi:hypothetical protein ACYJA9_001618 [Campylobacter upsaliensis]|nr:hypothetical protein [Campylobacter upsaliensis]EAI7238376.1 hypothetical protein [Campylobacter upsaliensis]EAJ4318284.1 hypothetical protein [Campylobacter upsaliensis]EAK1781544.1 hypothetical protein [Campylobacter upsaliensis]EAL3918580.1 hypothetical protein [Campylobacter upsaliensis]
MNFKLSLIFIGALLFSACSNGAKSNATFENALINKYCNEEIFATNLQKLEQNDDVIYTGLNVGLIARNCGDFNKSNVFFDKAEESYKYDVDLQNVGKKGAKVVATTLINDTIVDYEGSLYERIMVNVYKGLNFMSLNDYANARVEFNRALMRQDKAKEYFAKEIEKNREELKKAKEDPNYKQNMNENAKIIDKEYEHLFEAFDTTKNFINPYATYLASVFFFMDNDFRKAGGLFREVAAINSKNAEIVKQAKFFKSASSKSSKSKKKYIFVVYENGFGVMKDDFALTLPFLVEGKIISTSVALQTLKKREGSFEFIEANGAKTSQFVDLDNIVATEFKINMPAMISKALAQTILKTTLNLAVANNDSTGGWLTLASSVATAATNRADVRSWRGLPKRISVAMVENKGEISVKNPQGTELFSSKLDKKKNALVIVRSFSPVLPVNVQVIEK